MRIRISMEVPALHLDRVDVQVGNVDVARTKARGLPLAWIGAIGVGDLITTAMRQRERPITVADTGEVC